MKSKILKTMIKEVENTFVTRHIEHMLSDDWEGDEEIFVPEDECSKPFNTPKIL